jgi:hypothetical protein
MSIPDQDDVELRFELVKTLIEVEELIEGTKAVAKEVGCSPYQLKHSDGSFMMASVLNTKAMCLSGLATLNLKEK